MAERDAAPPRPAFERTPNRQKPLVFESYCLICHCFIAASANLKLIDLAEACHSCPELP
jgi:hypothetical protein